MNTDTTSAEPVQNVAHVTLWRRLLDTDGETLVTTWEALWTRFSKPRRFDGDGHPGWSAALFRDGKRELTNVLHVTAAVLDYDGTELWGRAVKTWAGCYGFMHSSKQHTDDLHRFRVVLPLKRAVTAEEWARLWVRLNDYTDGRCDKQAKDASRFWYVPGTLDGSAPKTQTLDGEPLDPDEWLARPSLAEQQAKREAERSRTTAPYVNTSDDYAMRVKRATGYVSKMDGATAGQGGHLATWRAAIELARGFDLDEATTLHILRTVHNPKCQPQWSEKELAHKAKQAATRATVPRGYRLERDRADWKAPAAYYEEPPAQSFDPETGEVLDDDIERDSLIDEGKTTLRLVPSEPLRARSMSEILGKVLERAKSGKSEMGIKTGHYLLDHVLCGFRPGKITVLGARTSFGKSSYSIMVTDEALRLKRRVLLVTVEDTEDVYGQRFMARRARVNAFRLRSNDVSQADILRMEQQCRAAEREPFFIDAIGYTAEEIAGAILSASPAPELVIVDYAQKLRAGRRTQDRRTEVTYVVSVISDAIKKIGAAGLVLSQIKRLEGQPDKEPTMSDLKESGDIENMAEHVLLGWLEDEDNHDAPNRKRWIKVEKNKDGPVDSRAILLPFDDATASFKVTNGHVEPPPRDEFEDDFQNGTGDYR